MIHKFFHSLHLKVARKKSRTILDLLARVVLPGFFVLYLFITQDDFLRQFNKDFPVLMHGEIIFLSFHIMLTYFVLPVVWLCDAIDFFWRDSDVPHIIGLFYKSLAGSFYWLLLFAITIRIIAGY